VIDATSTSTRTTGDGYGNQGPDGFPPEAFIDYFNNGDDARYANVTIPATGGAQYLALQNRAGHNGGQDFSVEFYAPGQETPLYTAAANRYRQTGWQGSAWSYAPLTGASVPAGTYDVRIVTTREGGHLAGLGTWSPKTVLTQGVHRIEADSYSWSRNSATPSTGDSFATGGAFMDNNLGVGDGWFDFEVHNPSAANQVSVTLSTRGDGNGPTTFSVRAVEIDGDLSPVLTTITVEETNGWGNSPFTQTAGATTFALPEGYSALRLEKQSGAPFHLDWMELSVVPEPTTGAILALAGGALLAGRRRRVAR
jgi:hypothetical protein